MESDYLMTSEERLIFSLRRMWRDAGYASFRVSQAEEYDFYVRYKEFLDNREIITFTDRDGTLMALKSDVTLSLVRKIKDSESLRRVMYNEKIYRIPQFSSSFREIEQTGLECLGPLVTENIVEVACLALKSLERVGERCCLTLSHMAIMNSLLENVGDGRKKEILSLVKRRKTDALLALGERDESLKGVTETLSFLLDSTLGGIELCRWMRTNGINGNAVDELEAVMTALGEKNVVLDFSSLGSFGYYNGIIMKGYVLGLTRPVLLGGEYSLLLRRMDKKIARAVGFAIYMDELEEKEND